MVLTNTYAKDFTDDEAKMILGNIVKSFEKTTLSKKDITLNGFPGVEIVHERELP